MKTMQRMAVVILAVMAGTNAGAATVISKATGNWTEGTTWSTGSQPGSGDTVNVYSNFTVRLSNTTNIGTNATINVGSTTAAQGAGNLEVFNLGVLNVTNVILGNVNSTLSVTNGGQVLSSGSLTIGANAAGQDNNTVVVSGSDANGNRATWMGTNGYLRLSLNNGVGNGFIVRDGAYAAFGKTSFDGTVGYGNGASNNYIIVTGADGNGNKATLTYATYIGLGMAAGANGNYVIVSNNATLVGGLTLGGNASTNNYVFVGEGGSYSGQLKLGNHSATFGNYMIVTNGGVATIANSSGIGLGGGVSNYLAVGGTDGGGNKAKLVLMQTFDIGAVANAASNCLWVGPGGLVTNGFSSTITLGKVAGANGNYVVVSRGGSIIGGTVSPGYGASTNNYLLVEGGEITGVTLNVGYNTSSAVGNYVLLSDGGLLEAPTIRVGKDATTVDNAVLNRGGVIQFSSAAPTIAVVANNAIVMDSGALSYRGIKTGTLPNLTNNTGTATVGLFTWPNGTTNGFRLNDCYATNSVAGGYTFAYEAGNGKQYARLELVNGAPELRGQPVTIGAGGTLYVESAAATLRSSLTLAAGATLALGATNGLSVTVTGGLTVGGAGALVLPAGLAKDAEFKLMDVTGSVPSAGTLRSWTDAAGKFRLDLRNGTQVWVTPQPPRGTLIQFL